MNGSRGRPGLRAAGREYVDEVLDDRLPGLAAETAFFVVLSMFPALLVGGSLLGLLEALVGNGVAEQARDRVLDLLSLVLTDEASGVLESVRSLFEESRGGLLTFATAGALVSLSGAFAVAINALNLAHDVAEMRSWLRRRLLGLVMAIGTLLLGVLGLGVLVVGPLFGRGEQLAELVGLGSAFTFVWNGMRLPAMALLLLAWATILLRTAPSRRVRWRDALPGALLAGALWGLATVGFRIYLGFAAESNRVLGAFGGGAIVMTWTYLLSLGLLLGGELNAVLVQRREVSGTEGQQLTLFDAGRRGH
ncbi:MAG: YihY/virulence factor BrkB family protein [Mycobacteriales bacterium]